MECTISLRLYEAQSVQRSQAVQARDRASGWPYLRRERGEPCRSQDNLAGNRFVHDQCRVTSDDGDRVRCSGVYRLPLHLSSERRPDLCEREGGS